jgi:RNA recognition motif-containing protein
MNAVAKSQSEHTTILVGNLAEHAREEDIKALFRRFGSISAVRMIPGAPNRRGDGRCYLKMRGRPAKAAISALNDKAVLGSVLRVTEVHAQTGNVEEPRSAAEGEQPRQGSRLRYQVDSVEKAKMPAETEGQDWYRYVLSSGSSRITGFHRGSRAKVTEYASQCVEEFNLRNVSGKSRRAMAPPKKKT